MANPMPVVAPMEVCVRGLRGGHTSMCVSGPKFEYDKIKKQDRRIEQAKFLEIPPAPFVLRLTAENVKINGFDTVPQALAFLTKNYMGPRGEPLYLHSVMQGVAAVPASFMDLGALLVEIEARTRVKPAKGLSREAAVKVVRALRSICAEDIETPAEQPSAVVAGVPPAATSGVLDDLMKDLSRKE